MSQGMTACRPTKPAPQCAYCVRQRLPTYHMHRNGMVVEHVVMDPPAVLKPGKVCPLFEEAA
jgi:hypothetical protein